MSPLPRLIMISGWAHDAAAIEELCRRLESTTEVSSVSTGDLWSAETEICATSSYAQNLVRMIEKTDRKIFLAGWSLGGMIALETAACRPDLIAGLVLISSTVKFRADQNWTSGVPGRALRAMTAMLKYNPRGVFANFFANAAQTFETKIQRLGTKAEIRASAWQRREKTIALKIEKACAMNPLELSAGLEYLSEADLRSVARRVNIPALILHGREDAIIPVEAGFALKNLLPVSEIRIYENYGHGLPWQNPRALAKDIMKFIKECEC